MNEFFKVVELDQAFSHIHQFQPLGTEKISLTDSLGRVLAVDVISNIDLPDFPRATMDGFAVQAKATFGASEGNPAYLTLKGSVAMGEAPAFRLNPGETARIATGGMLPEGSDSVIMIEYAEMIDEDTVEVYRSVAPGQHTIARGEDFSAGTCMLSRGTRIRAQEIGLLAAYGHERITVYQKPVVGIISTGDEVVSIDQTPPPGCIRDINAHTLSAYTMQTGGVPVRFGIARDNQPDLLNKCRQALESSDMVLISGGSSVGKRDFTVDVLQSLNEATLLFHGISISPGKPTLLYNVRGKAVWGLPGHVVSSMIVFKIVVQPFIEALAGLQPNKDSTAYLSARLSRNIASAQGRIDFVRVRLSEKNGTWYAEPLIGKSGLLNTMVKADGLVKIDMHAEGLDQNAMVAVLPLA